ncbi:MAG: Cytochrome subunit of sulfide dehydrogenase [Catillopecten margaritatus gill symbiont]|uniref:Cytochrome subunit of sulfide dehydrogenase n=1 Tax=Catillopecten margaritatus gill symbiont TaxID=3083288 RepID=A0AAU6PEH2_9GAMM
MKKTLIKPILTASGLVLLMSIGQVQASAPNAEALSYTCAGCHGTNGASNGPSIPSLAGLSKDYLVEAMEAYKEDERNPTIMNRIAKGYSTKQFEQMGDFFSAQPVHMIKGQKFDSAKAKAGKKLHKKYCSSCHSEGGTVTDDEAGQLAGNAANFLRFALDDFHAGRRDMPKKMKKKIKKMLKKDKDAFEKLVHYYSKGE